MEKIIIYCHGYGSSSNSSKLQQIKDAGFEAYCFDADIHPHKALKHLTKEIDTFLIDDNRSGGIQLIFVGTSLGGWMAAELAPEYGAKSVIINPSINPKTSLLKYGVSEEICNLYEPIKFSKKAKYFFADKDEVIDNEEIREYLINEGLDVSVVPGADHRFDKHFNIVLEYLKNA
jgi:predicted esterase YcpF (UPF0227 family)